MGLRWWPLIAVGILCLAGCIAAAALLPMPKVHRQLRPLAHVDRLTRLPEYARVYRIYFLSVVITGALLLATFATALVASARPMGMSSVTKEFEVQHPEDIMLCVGEPVTDPTTANFLGYYAQQAKSYGTQRIGLTSTSLRVVPLTRDHRYAAERFEHFAKLARTQQDLAANKAVPENDRRALQSGIEEFSQRVSYVDYATSLEDNLALCLTGFPSFDSKSTHRRSLVYIGYSAPRPPNEKRPGLFTAQAVQKMAADAGVQINAIARSDVAQSSPQANDTLRSIAESTGGKFFLYNPSGITASDSGADVTLTRILDHVRDNPPQATLPNGKVVSIESFDSPRVALVAALAFAALLGLSLAVLRR
jgi:hypothetical protein